jgi:hypothetical protein
VSIVCDDDVDGVAVVIVLSSGAIQSGDDRSAAVQLPSVAIEEALCISISVVAVVWGMLCMNM